MAKNNKAFLDTGMRDLLHVFGNPEPPQVITQIPFDHDDRHYRKLCSLDPGYDENPVDGIDFLDYSLDLKYQELQPDLFLYAFPLCLNFWRNDLINGSNYGGAVDEFLGAMAKHNGFHTLLNENQYAQTANFMSHAILEKMSMEQHRSFVGERSSPFTWIEAIAAYAHIFPNMIKLWDSWWESQQTGHSLCKLQYLSLFMYREDENPIFSKHTPEKGGGAPIPWRAGGHIYDQPWLPDNINFLKINLTAENVEQLLIKTSKALANTADDFFAHKLLDDFQHKRWFVELRIEEFLDIISGDPAYIYDWQTQ